MIQVGDELLRIYLAKQAVRGVARLRGGDCRISCRDQIQNVDPLGQSKPFPQVPKRDEKILVKPITQETHPRHLVVNGLPPNAFNILDI